MRGSPPKSNSSSSPRTVEVRPNPGEMIKAAELIDITGANELTLSARRLYNLLIDHAHGPNMTQEGYKWTMVLADLRGTHKGNERLQDSILALMKTVVTVHHADGTATENVHLLGWNKTDTKEGTFTFKLSPELAALMQDSTIFGKLELRTMTAFTTKYALALYEAIARRVRLNYVFHEDFTIDRFRELLGVPKGKLTTFGNLNNRAIRPAVAEINALSGYSVMITPLKEGRRVTSVRVGWWQKEPHEMAAVMAELGRHSAGRKARIKGAVDQLAEV